MAELPQISPNNPNVSFNGPIPGASLTTEKGNRPWENPPKESDLDTVILTYIRRLKNPETVQPILDAVRYGTSITTIVESVIEAAVMEGQHTIDVGILAAPVIVEFLKQASEVANIDYKLSHNDIEKAKKVKTIDSRLLEQVLMEMEENKGTPAEEDIEIAVEETKIANKGLMSKKMDNKGDLNGI
tara:strand:+ start:1371 stop:1928 length:558 start_codon:yes stop_codon:yes gene_type:complete